MSKSNQSPLIKLFEDPHTVKQIQESLPEIFWILNSENSRGGKIGMEVGSARKWPIIALLIKKFGRNNVNTDIPINFTQTNVVVGDRPVSIRTITKEHLEYPSKFATQYSKSSGIKAFWSGDTVVSRRTLSRHRPVADILLIQVNFNGGNGKKGIFALITKELQEVVLKRLGPNQYFHIPGSAQNSRGAEFTIGAIMNFLNHPDLKSIDITWNRPPENGHANPWDRWSGYW